MNLGDKPVGVFLVVVGLVAGWYRVDFAWGAMVIGLLLCL